MKYRTLMTLLVAVALVCAALVSMTYMACSAAVEINDRNHRAETPRIIVLSPDGEPKTEPELPMFWDPKKTF